MEKSFCHLKEKSQAENSRSPGNIPNTFRHRVGTKGGGVLSQWDVFDALCVDIAMFLCFFPPFIRQECTKFCRSGCRRSCVFVLLVLSLTKWCCLVFSWKQARELCGFSVFTLHQGAERSPGHLWLFAAWWRPSLRNLCPTVAALGFWSPSTWTVLWLRHGLEGYLHAGSTFRLLVRADKEQGHARCGVRRPWPPVRFRTFFYIRRKKKSL